MKAKPKKQSRKDYDQPRRLGRVSDKDWKKLKSASKKSGRNFTKWALGHLLEAAEREET